MEPLTNSKERKKFKKIVILDSVIFYPKHRKILYDLAEKVEEYPSSLPENLERQYVERPELFENSRCYTQIAADNVPLQLLMNRCDGAEVIVSCWTNIPDEVIKINKQLKLIIFWTHEKEHRINMKLAKQRGITVCNIPDYGTDSVSEVVFVGLLSLIKLNFSEKKSKYPEELFLGVMQRIFEKYRLLDKNTKKTRRGQFVHHFHKLGEIEFNITNENLDSIIPEKLIEGKNLGIIGKNTDFDCIEKTAKNAFKMNVSRVYKLESNLAEYYKLLDQSEVIVIDSGEVGDKDYSKIKKLYRGELIDLKEIEGINYDLKNKQLGIIGLGRIGKRVAKIAKELGMKVVYYSETRKTDLEKELDLKFLELSELLRTSDIISLHIAAHKADGLLSKEKLDLIKQGAIFINTADGNIVDQKYLTKLMLRKKVYAFLDVYPGLPRKDVLGLEMTDKNDWKIKNNLKEHILTYRAGWKSQESIGIKTYKLLGQMSDFLLRGAESAK